MISVLIRAGNDENIFECITSVKKTSPKSQIIISTIANSDLRERIANLKLEYCTVPRKNMSLTSNKGLELIKTNKVLITDSDTIFGKKCIDLLAKALDTYSVVKPQLIFQNNGSLQSVLVANLRAYFNSKKEKMFTPGLAFRMSIKNKIGGYYFDTKVTRAEDSEFSSRVEANNLKTYVERKAKLFHTSIAMSHDLSGAFLTGAKKPETKTLMEIISKRIKTYTEIFNMFGFLTILYGLVWYLFFDFGKLSKHTGKIGRLIQNYFWKL